MKFTVHRADTRGFANMGWLKSFYSFSFARYYNQYRMGFGALRVLNDDIIDGGQGFPEHPHDNMEIISIPIYGALEHRDSAGNKGVVGEYGVQVMSAGEGVVHSEYNHSKTDPANFLQLWIDPRDLDVPPRHEEKTFNPAGRRNKLQVVVSPERGGESLFIYQDAWLSLADLDGGASIAYEMHKPGNGVYVFMIDGAAEIEGETLGKRDAMGIEETEGFTVTADRDAMILFVEVPMVAE
jgi:redox-sensitive bicupin YhaK (pirin superfamily)